MIYIEAPTVYTGTRPSIFLAGGITGCRNWQLEVVDQLKDSSFAVLNPRRDDFPIGDPDAAPAQIKWEFDHLQNATVILFWFTPDTLQPIALYELGRWSSQKTKPIIVGADPDYARRQDVEIQLGLSRPDLHVYHDLKAMVKDIIEEKSNEEAAIAYRVASYRFYNG